jgi:hypothetical protein
MALTNLYLPLSMSEVREPPVDCMLPLRATSPPHPSFLTAKTQRCRMGYGFEKNMSGMHMNFVNALVLVPLLTSLSVNLQVIFLSLA